MAACDRGDGRGVCMSFCPFLSSYAWTSRARSREARAPAWGAGTARGPSWGREGRGAPRPCGLPRGEPSRGHSSPPGPPPNSLACGTNPAQGSCSEWAAVRMTQVARAPAPSTRQCASGWCASAWRAPGVRPSSEDRPTTLKLTVLTNTTVPVTIF